MSSRPTWTGHFDQQHIARLNFTLHSAAGQDTLSLDGIIDTGFTGFVQVPLNAGAVLGLLIPPLTVGNSILANGAKQPTLLKQVQVTVNGETQSGVCQIPWTPNSPVLIGMDFLRRFNRMLIVSSTFGVKLVPERPVS